MSETPALRCPVRPATAEDADAIRAVVTAAFVAEPQLGDLVDELARRTGTISLVAEHAGEVVGHVAVSRAWIDTEPALVEVRVLGPLGVTPAAQGKGVGRLLIEQSIAAADGDGCPVLLLEGDPAFYGRFGFRPAVEFGITPPSVRIPAPAFQAIVFASYEPWMRGAAVYGDPFWSFDAVGLRGEYLAEVRAALGVAAGDG